MCGEHFSSISSGHRPLVRATQGPFLVKIVQGNSVTRYRTEAPTPGAGCPSLEMGSSITVFLAAWGYRGHLRSVMTETMCWVELLRAHKGTPMFSEASAYLPRLRLRGDAVQAPASCLACPRAAWWPAGL